MIQYKTVPGPVGITIDRKDDYEDAVRQYASIIDEEAVGGWQFECIRAIPVTKEAGCIARLFGRRDETLFINMLIFSKDDSKGISSDGTSIAAIEATATQLAGGHKAEGEAYSSNPVTESAYQDNVPEIHGTEPNNSADASAHDGKNRKMIWAVACGAVLIAAIICILAINNSSKDNSDEFDYSYEPNHIDDSEITGDVDGFFTMAQGVWVSYADIDTEGDNNMLRFYFVKFADGEMQTGYYASDVTNIGQVTDAVKTGDNSYNITVYYPALPEEYLNGPREEFWGNYAVNLSYSEIGDPQLTIYNDGTYVDSYTLFSKSGDIEEAAERAMAYLESTTASSNGQWITANCSGDTAELIVQSGAAYEMTINAHIGANGITYDKTEGDRCTPAGTFNILYYKRLSHLVCNLTLCRSVRAMCWSATRIRDTTTQYRM